MRLSLALLLMALQANAIKLTQEEVEDIEAGVEDAAGQEKKKGK